MEGWKLVAAGGVMTLLGMAAGAQLFGAQEAVAQDAAWRECFFGWQEAVDIDTNGVVAAVDRAHSITVPSGYTVISGGGGGGGGGAGFVLFCRR